MKIKTVNKTYDEVMALPRPKHQRPVRPNILFRTLIRLLSIGDMLSTRFTYRMDEDGMPDEPCLILMNHSSFIDLKIASRILYPKPYGIVCTSDGMIGKSWLMRRIGCIPTQKYVTDLSLIRDMKYALHEKKMSVLMYPEAGYSMDGCATALPDHLGGLVKLLKVPVVMITTYGAFARDPLYNGLQNRRVKVSADVRCLVRRDQLDALSAEEIQARLHDAFTFDSFQWQSDNQIQITESFRADGLERILYKCASCGAEGYMEGKGELLTCHACGKQYRMDVLGRLQALDGKTEYPHIPTWYRWERACVRQELENGTYGLDTAVDIGMTVDYKALYLVGGGRLVHDASGFVLTLDDGRVVYAQKPQASYGLNSDYFWYEIGDMIGIGNRDALFYCFPKQKGVVTKTRLAAEELYKMTLLRKVKRK